MLFPLACLSIGFLSRYNKHTSLFSHVKQTENRAHLPDSTFGICLEIHNCTLILYFL